MNKKIPRLNKPYTYTKMLRKYLQKIIVLVLIALPLITLANHVVITNNATNITTNSATLNGTVTSNSGISSAKFRYATSLPIGGSFLGCISMPLAQGYVEVNATIGPAGYGGVRDLSANISQLQPGTTYYFCALATSHNATQFGTIFSFTTLLTNPSGGGSGSGGTQGTGINMIPATAVGEVSTINPASEVTDTEATFHGSVSGIEGGTAYGYFRYSAQKTPPVFCNDIFGSNMKSVTAGETGANRPSGIVTNGSFDAKVTNLVPNTVYYYCAVVSNGAKSSTIIKYGQVKSVRTFPCQTCEQTQINTLPTVVLNGSSVNLYGSYGSTKALNTYFEYKSSEIAGDWKKTPEESHTRNSYGRMIAFVQGLRPDTHYFVRAVGRTSEPTETFYGQTLQFKTNTADGFGDGEGWIYDGPETTIIGNGGPLDPTQNCGQPSGPDAPLVNCDDNNNNGCPAGTTGTPPNCVGNPPPLPCSEGWSGIPPNCVQNPTECPVGYAGVFPDCDIILIDICLYGGTYPNCSDTGNTCTFGGTYPDCNNPPGTCPFGGTYPNCNGGNGNGGNSGGGGNGGTDIDGDGISNNNDTDIDGDGVGNTGDNDTDGDGIGNGFDSDDDNDGIFDSSDQTPLGNGSNFNDLDGDGLSNNVDTDDDGDGIPDLSDTTPFGTSFNLGDLDGDGIANDIDTDMDGDGIPDNSDTDDDNDGIPDNIDQSPRGRNSRNNNQGGILGIGDETTPPQDAIVRYHEGVETVLIRQIMRNTTLAKKYGYRDGEDLEKFSWYLAHFLGKSYGYVAKNKKEVRVRFADVAAYELREVGNTTTVYESYDNAGNGKFKITGVRKLNSLFKMIFKYEYYFLKRR